MYTTAISSSDRWHSGVTTQRLGSTVGAVGAHAAVTGVGPVGALTFFRARPAVTSCGGGVGNDDLAGSPATTDSKAGPDADKLDAGTDRASRFGRAATGALRDSRFGAAQEWHL